MAKKPYEFETRFSDIERELEERKNKVQAMPFKVCSKCGEIKPIYKFSKDKRNSDGRLGVCKECRSKEALEYYYNNKDKILIRVKKYQETHKKDRSNYFKDYRRDHKEHLKSLAGKWYRENRKRIKKRNLKRRANLITGGK